MTGRARIWSSFRLAGTRGYNLFRQLELSPLSSPLHVPCGQTSEATTKVSGSKDKLRDLWDRLSSSLPNGLEHGPQPHGKSLFALDALFFSVFFLSNVLTWVTMEMMNTGTRKIPSKRPGRFPHPSSRRTTPCSSERQTSNFEYNFFMITASVL